ncbi:SDR family NAD(P)-dependent oxidoreductase [Nonomuraea sp. NPDC049480]|uniref:SDR family NAD(P)-dependent oxidoreductase n=1 Tax=Nonomuraea sp. NPDC049480 TaxID=3364353 RepID=UPI0037A012A6
MSPNWTAESVPSQQGRTVVITGANSGIGWETATVLAARGASVVLAVRDVDKGKQAAARITAASPGAHVTVQRLDLASLASVRAAAEELRADHPTIDLLINNAGVSHIPREITVDGFERQFATNHLGHFALTGLLLEAMLPVRGSRAVTVSAIAHRTPNGIDFDDLRRERSYNAMAVYGQSKLANLMFTHELQRRLSGGDTTIAVAAHPGLARTDLSRNASLSQRALFKALSPLLQSAAMGALPVLRAATDPDVRGGQYYGPGGSRPREARGYPTLAESSPASHDVAGQRRLWAVSEELTGVLFPV